MHILAGEGTKGRKGPSIVLNLRFYKEEENWKQNAWKNIQSSKPQSQIVTYSRPSLFVNFLSYSNWQNWSKMPTFWSKKDFNIYKFSICVQNDGTYLIKMGNLYYDLFKEFWVFNGVVNILMLPFGYKK